MAASFSKLQVPNRLSTLPPIVSTPFSILQSNHFITGSSSPGSVLSCSSLRLDAKISILASGDRRTPKME